MHAYVCVLVHVCVCVCGGGQRTTCRREFSLSTTGVQKIKLGLAGLMPSTCYNGLNEKCPPLAFEYQVSRWWRCCRGCRILDGVVFLLEEVCYWELWVMVFYHGEKVKYLLSHFTSPIDPIYFNKKLLNWQSL